MLPDRSCVALAAVSGMVMRLRFRELWREGGIRSFYIGLSINYIKVAPTVGLSFVTNETVRRFLGI